MTPGQRQRLIRFLNNAHIENQLSSPTTFTSSVGNKNAIVIKAANQRQLESIIKKIHTLNSVQNKKGIINATVIGGGRGGNNNSYSINKTLWKGVDVFIQLGWEPTVNSRREIELKDEVPKTTKTLRISPNIMLIELNKQLYDKGYHCPTLCGGLPFMSFAGGLSTRCHTAYGYLSDIVSGIELLLPNGKYVYIKKGDKHFDLVCQKASLGLLGTITHIDIEVEKTKKKLQRHIEVSTFDTFLDNIKRQVDDGLPLESRSAIFSSVNLKKDSPVKLTRWSWVDAITPSSENVRPQVAGDFLSNNVAPALAATSPKTLSSFFKKQVITNAGTVVAEPQRIMAPEDKLSGQITESGVIFEYNERMQEVLNRLSSLLNYQRDQHQYPINTAIFIRFVKKPNSAGHEVALDFTSYGHDLQATKALVGEFQAFLTAEGIENRSHYGKSNSVKNPLDPEYEWTSLKEKYLEFYEDFELDRSLLTYKISLLEGAKILKQPLMQDDTAVCQSYLIHCEKNKRYLEDKMDEALKNYPNFKNYYTSKRTGKIKYAAILKDMKEVDTFKSKPYLTFNQCVLQQRMERIKATQLPQLLKKYEIILELKETLTTGITPNVKRSNFEKTLDNKRKELEVQRDDTTLRWLAVFAAGLIGLAAVGIGSYYAAKATHHLLFTTKSKEILVNSVDKIRSELYNSPD